MRKLMLGIAGTLALLVAGILAWNADATTLTSPQPFTLKTNYALGRKSGLLATRPAQHDARKTILSR
jgi:hypothetical protein